MMGRAARIAVAFACCCTMSFAARADVGVVGVEILELDQLVPDTTIGCTVPTGMLTLQELDSLNLLVWARNVTNVLVSTVNGLSSDPSGQLDAIVATAQALIDPDLTVHACAVDGTGSCDIEIGQSEDKNRYLDMILHYQTEAGVESIRVLTAEDGAKSLLIDYPLSFNVFIATLRLKGVAQSREYLGKNLAQADAGRHLDAENLDWLGGGLIDSIVETTQSWDAENVHCSPRYNAAKVDFQTAIMNKIVAFEDTATDDWSVSFDDSVADGSQAGITFAVEYALCGHLMKIPVAIESPSFAASALPVLV